MVVRDQRMLGAGGTSWRVWCARSKRVPRPWLFQHRRQHLYFRESGRPGRHVTFEIREGPKVKVTPSSSTKHDFSDERLREQFTLGSSKVGPARLLLAKDVEIGAEI